MNASIVSGTAATMRTLSLDIKDIKKLINLMKINNFY
jgi:hypothetical protein